MSSIAATPSVLLSAGLLLVPGEATADDGPPWTLDGSLEIDSIAERRFDLDAGQGDVVTLEPRVELGFGYEPRDGLRFQGQVRLSHGAFLNRGEEARSSETKLELRQAFVAIEGPRPGLSLQLGRQPYEDERDWWYDEDLDTLRLQYSAGRFGLELSAGRNEIVAGDVLNRDRAKAGDIFIAAARYSHDEDAELGAYLIALDNRSTAREKPWFFGLRSIGTIGSALDHWIDVALVRGSDEGTDIRAWGFDAGISWPFDAPLQPSLHLGIAFGSGDSDPLDSVDSEFRQTGLQSSYFYYGEVLAPELSNLWIHTAGFELEPAGSTTIRLIYHRYRQHRAADAIRDALIERDPDGQSRDIGEALDFVVSRDIGDRAWLDFVVGVFEPGAAFGPGAGRAYFGQLTLAYEFR